MKRIIISGVFGLCLLASCFSSGAQDLPKKDESKAENARSEGPQLKVQITFAEYDGEKKVKSLPYTLLLQARVDVPGTKIRMGSRVPVYTGGEHGSMQYIDVGTNIDCRASTTQDGRYHLSLSLERSWVEGDVFVPVQKAAAPTTDPAVGQFAQPIIRQFRSENNVTLRDGQTIETDFATDPASGKVIKVEITINVMK
jgi:hypothetical protein